MSSITRRAFIGAALASGAACLVGGLATSQTKPASALEGQEPTYAGSLAGKEYLYATYDSNKKLWGYVDKNGSWAIAAQFKNVASRPGMNVGDAPITSYAAVSPTSDNLFSSALGLLPGVFYNDLSSVQDSSGKWGYIDRKGEWRIQAKYDAAYNFNEGLALVRSGSNLLFIKQDGSSAFGNLDCSAATCFNQGVAFLHGTSGSDSWGCINKDGSWALASSNDATNPYRMSAPVVFSEGIGYFDGAFIDVAGNTVIDMAAKSGALAKITLTNPLFHEGMLPISWDSSGPATTNPTELVVLDKTGSEIIQMENAAHLGGHGYSAGLCAAESTIPGMSPIEHYYGFIDAKGQWAVPVQFSLTYAFREGLACVQEPSTKLLGFIDTSGSWVIPPRFIQLTNLDWCAAGFCGGLCYMEADTNASDYSEASRDKCGWIDTTGAWVASWS